MEKKSVSSFDVTTRARRVCRDCLGSSRPRNWHRDAAIPSLQEVLQTGLPTRCTPVDLNIVQVVNVIACYDFQFKSKSTAETCISRPLQGAHFISLWLGKWLPTRLITAAPPDSNTSKFNLSFSLAYSQQSYFECLPAPSG